MWISLSDISKRSRLDNRLDWHRVNWFLMGSEGCLLANRIHQFYALKDVSGYTPHIRVDGQAPLLSAHRALRLHPACSTCHSAYHHHCYCGSMIHLIHPTGCKLQVDGDNVKWQTWCFVFELAEAFLPKLQVNLNWCQYYGWELTYHQTLLDKLLFWSHLQSYHQPQQQEEDTGDG